MGDSLFNKELNIDNLKVKKEIGKGAFSVVFLAEYNNKDYALKKYNNKNNLSYYANREIRILDDISKIDILEKPITYLLNHFVENNISYLVMDKYKYNLYDYYRSGCHLSYSNITYIANEVVIGLKYIHKIVVHCDLKPENIMITNDKKIKIIDFGSAYYLEKLKKKEKFDNLYIQSRFYRAPEILFSIRYNEKIDIWSLGCILYELIFYKPLFDGKNALEMVYMISKKLGIPEEIRMYKDSLNFKRYFKKTSLSGILSKNTYSGISPFTDLSNCDNCLEKYLTDKLNERYSHKENNEVEYLIKFLLRVLKYDYEERASAEDLEKDILFSELK